MDNFIGEIRTFAFSNPPEGWLECNGAELSVTQYQPLFAVIGTRFGRSGLTFAVPNFVKSEAPGTIICIASEGIFPVRK